MVWLTVLVIILVAIFFVPQKVVVSLHIRYNEHTKKLEKIPNMKNQFAFKLFFFIPVYKTEIKKKDKDKKKQNEKKTNGKTFFKQKKDKILKEILLKAYVEEFGLSLGFNLKDYVINSNANAAINSILCIIINANQKKFNLNKLYYQTYISEELLILHFDSIITINFANTIKVIVKQYLKYHKEKKQIVNFVRRSDVYGRTSN